MDEYINIKWQEGPVKEVGVNGCQIEDVVQGCIHKLRELNQPPYSCRENSIAITKLEEAWMWLHARWHRRMHLGVEGTSAPEIDK